MGYFFLDLSAKIVKLFIASCEDGPIRQPFQRLIKPVGNGSYEGYTEDQRRPPRYQQPIVSLCAKSYVDPEQAQYG